MSIKFLKKIPTVEEIMETIPVPQHIAEIKKAKDAEIKKVFEGTSDKFILIIGPCSADSEAPVLTYLEKMAKVQEKVKDKIIIIPRIYTNKPRTTGEGYKGMMHQPDPNKEPDVAAGILAIRNLHLKALSEFHMPAADEMLYPENYTFLSDLLGYVAIGARSVENQQHRLVVSGIDVPGGMKNPTSGDITVMLNSIKAAQISHSFIYNNHEVETSGNPLAHAILRGAVDSYGRNIPNYHYEDLIHLAKLYEKQGLQNPAIIVDTNHANSMKMYSEQPRIAKEIINSKKYNPVLGNLVKGLMIESYLQGGRQEIGEEVFGKSITDPCLGWDESEKLIYHIADNL